MSGEIELLPVRVLQYNVGHDASGLAGRSNPGMQQQLVGYLSAPTSHTGDTNETVLASLTVPANAMGANGQLLVSLFGSLVGTAGAKTWRIRQTNISGAVLFQGAVAAANLNFWFESTITNIGATNSQVANAVALVGPSGSSAGSMTTAAIDTTASQTFVITVTNASAADNSILQWFNALVVRPTF